MLGRLGPFHVVPGQTISTYSSPVWNFIGNPWEFPKKKTWFNIKLSMIFPSAQHGHVFGSHFLRPWPSSVNCGSVWSWPSAKPALHAKNVHRPPGKTGKTPGKTPGTSPMTPIFGEKTWRWFLSVPIGSCSSQFRWTNTASKEPSQNFDLLTFQTGSTPHKQW